MSNNYFYLQATGVEGPLPSWLWVDGHHGVIRGVPGPEERGEHRLLVTALSENKDDNECPPATDVFTIEVRAIRFHGKTVQWPYKTVKKIQPDLT